MAFAQTDNTFYAKGFAGPDVGTKVTNAQASCSVNPSIACYVVIDASLLNWPAGTLPTPCANCYIVDYRYGTPFGSGGGGGGNTTSTGGTVNNIAKFNATHAIVNSQLFDDGSNPVLSPNGYSIGTTGDYGFDLPNDGTTGTVLWTATCNNGHLAGVVCSHTSIPNQILGFTKAGAGTPGNSKQCGLGYCTVLFDNAATAGDIAIPSTSVDGQLHDTLSTQPPNGVPWVYIFSSNSGAGTTGKVRLLNAGDYLAIAPNQIFSLYVNSTPITQGDHVIFDNLIPAAPTNAFNIKFQSTVIGGTFTHVSAYLQTSGDATQFLNGQGNFSTPSLTFTHAATVTDISAGAGDQVLLADQSYAVTITGFQCGLTNSTSNNATVTLITTAETTLGTVATTILSSSLSVTTNALAAGTLNGSLTALGVRTPVFLKVTAVTGTPNVTCRLEYTGAD